MACEHVDFVANVDVNRIQASDDDPTIVAFSAEVRVKCAACGEAMIFVGAPIGLMRDRPCISPLGDELRVPLRPQSSDPHFGMGLPGFIARVHEGTPSSRN